MRINLKGINSITKRLADGTKRTYRDAWKILHRHCAVNQVQRNLSPAITKRWQARWCQRVAPYSASCSNLQASDDFTSLAYSTRRSYAAMIARIEKEFGDFPLSALTHRRSRGIFMAWRDKLAVSAGRRLADYAWTVLARSLSWGYNRGLVAANPCANVVVGFIVVVPALTRSGPSPMKPRSFNVRQAHLHLPLLLALWTGQRQGDLLRLPWSGYDGTHIRLRQGKTGARVVIPVGAPLKAALDAATKRSTIILTTIDGTPWTDDGFRASWAKARTKAGVVGVTFNDLRGTARDPM